MILSKVWCKNKDNLEYLSFTESLLKNHCTGIACYFQYYILYVQKPNFSLQDWLDQYVLETNLNKSIKIQTTEFH